jgi:hypothetical protein
MAIARITISVPEEVAKKIRKAAGKKPVSTWVTNVIEERLDDAELDRQWEAFYRDVNPGSRAEQEAKRILDKLTKPRRRKKTAA